MDQPGNVSKDSKIKLEKITFRQKKEIEKKKKSER